MSKNKLTFESENIVVDYLSFKFQHLEDWKEKELASYLSYPIGKLIYNKLKLYMDWGFEL